MQSPSYRDPALRQAANAADHMARVCSFGIRVCLLDASGAVVQRLLPGRARPGDYWRAARHLTAARQAAPAILAVARRDLPAGRPATRTVGRSSARSGDSGDDPEHPDAPEPARRGRCGVCEGPIPAKRVRYSETCSPAHAKRLQRQRRADGPADLSDLDLALDRPVHLAVDGALHPLTPAEANALLHRARGASYCEAHRIIHVAGCPACGELAAAYLAQSASVIRVPRTVTLARPWRGERGEQPVEAPVRIVDADALEEGVAALRFAVAWAIERGDRDDLDRLDDRLSDLWRQSEALREAVVA
ncbi:MAG: hypothetical protein ACYCUM_12235 [Solirubrobacteraceae bacterium]